MKFPDLFIRKRDPLPGSRSPWSSRLGRRGAIGLGAAAGAAVLAKGASAASYSPLYNGPAWDFISGSQVPGILRGTLDINDYMGRNGGVVGSGQTTTQRQTNATVLQAAFNYAASNSLFVEWPAGIIEINNSAGIVLATSGFGGMHIVGQGAGLNALWQFASNAPIFTVGDATGSTLLGSITLDGLGVFYGSSQTGSTSSTAFNVVSMSNSRFSNIFVNNNAGSAPYNGIVIGNPSNNTCSVFSCHFDTSWTTVCQNSLLAVYGYGTGNVYQNMYMNCSTGTSQPCTSPFIFANGANISESVFEQINIEALTTQTVMSINQGNATFISLHMEGIVMTGSGPSVWNLAGGSNCNVQIIGGSDTNVVFNSGEVTGTSYWYFVYDSAQLNVIGRHSYVSSPPVAQNSAVQLVYLSNGDSPQANRGNVKVENAYLSGYEGYMSIDANLPRATYGDADLVDGYEYATVWPRCRRTIIANPATNTVIYGSMGSEVTVIYRTALAANLVLVLGLDMMASGAAGQNTSRPTGDQIQVIRESSATGSFTITVKNATTGGSTVGTFSTSSAGTTQTFGYSGTAWTASP